MLRKRIKWKKHLRPTIRYKFNSSRPCHHEHMLHSGPIWGQKIHWRYNLCNFYVLSQLTKIFHPLILYSLEWNIKLSRGIIQKNINKAITSKFVDFNAVRYSLPTKGRTRNTFFAGVGWFASGNYFLAFSPLKYMVFENKNVYHLFMKHFWINFHLYVINIINAKSTRNSYIFITRRKMLCHAPETVTSHRIQLYHPSLPCIWQRRWG